MAGFRWLAGASVPLLAVLLVAGVTALPILLVPAAGLCIFVLITAIVGTTQMGHAMMLACVFTAPMMSVRPLVPVASFVTASDLALVLAIGLLAPVLLTRRLHPPVEFMVGWLLIISGGLIGSLLVSPAPAISINWMMRFVIAGFVLPLIFLLWAPTQRQIHIGAAAYLAGHVISTGVGLFQGPLENDRYVGLTHHSLFFGPAGLIATACALYLLPIVRKRSHQAWLIGGLLVCMASIVMSGSRACLVTAALLYVVFAVTHRSFVTVWWMLAGAVALGASFRELLASSTEGSAISRLAGDRTTEYADNRRTEELLKGLHKVAEHPFTGEGYLEVVEVHNVPLEMLVAGGVLGLIGFILVMFPMVKDAFRVSVGGGLTLIPITWLLTGLTVPRLWDRIIWVGLALAFAGLHLHVSGKEAPDPDAETDEPTPPDLSERALPAALR